LLHHDLAVMNDYVSSWSHSATTLATVEAQFGDDELTLTGTRRESSRPQTFTITPDDVLNTCLHASDGTVQYIVHTSTVNGGTSNASIRTSVSDAHGRTIGVHSVSVQRGSEVVLLGDNAPISRKDWLTINSPRKTWLSGPLPLTST